MARIVIEHKINDLFALVKLINGNETREYWVPEFLIPLLKAETKSNLKTLLADDTTDNTIGDLDV